MGVVRRINPLDRAVPVANIVTFLIKLLELIRFFQTSILALIL